ncbi:aminoglycoside phosphotransferase family protein [Acidihalobacter prosperus]
MASEREQLRINELKHWLAKTVAGEHNLTPASGDASFRRYFRLETPAGNRIVMDAPPDREPLAPFLDITHRLAAVDVNVPHIYAASPELGFALLNDLGNVHYLDILNKDNALELYTDALEALIRIQSASVDGLPDYSSDLLTREMELFKEWLVERHLNLTLTEEQCTQFDDVCKTLCENATVQPQVFVHRDYHSRNLMWGNTNNPGVLDYQDAVKGPITYDLVSLLRDAYIAWPETQVQEWALLYRDHAVAAGYCAFVEDNQFLKWFDLMGLQRHLKVLGIFARLYLRDNKPGYLKDLPRVLDYAEMVASRHPESAPLSALFNSLKLADKVRGVK